MADDSKAGDQEAAPGTPILERIVGAVGAVALLGVCAALGWDALRSNDRPPAFAFRVLEVVPTSGRHLVRFEVQNIGGTTAERVAVLGRLAAEPPETGRLMLDFLAAGEEREAAFLFTADPATFPLALQAESFLKP